MFFSCFVNQSGACGLKKTCFWITDISLLEEIELNIDNIDTIKLKEPNEVYFDIYKAAREKAKKAKNEAIKAYLEAKKIKELYMLDIIDSSDEEYEDSEEGEEYVEDDKLFSEN